VPKGTDPGTVTIPQYRSTKQSNTHTFQGPQLRMTMCTLCLMQLGLLSNTPVYFSYSTRFDNMMQKAESTLEDGSYPKTKPKVHKNTTRVCVCVCVMIFLCVCVCVCVSENSRGKWRKCISVTGSLRGKAQVRPLDKLDEACTNADDRMMLVQHCSGDRVMS